MTISPGRRLLAPILASVLLAGAAGLTACGGSSPATTSSTAASSGSTGVPGVAQPSAADFQPAKGQSIVQLAKSLSQGPHAALANSVFLPGAHQRLAFGLLDDSNKFVYAEAAVYVAPTVSAPARGPFVAPLDSTLVAPQFRSQTVANDPDSVRAVYYSSVPLARPGPEAALIVTRLNGRLYGSLAGFQVTRTSPIPNVGQVPPAIATPTVASVHGDVKSIDTRTPPDDMHQVSFKDVLGKRPVALVFATPQLCQSRVCGPVVDIAEQLKSVYGKRMTFIHQEVYANNAVQDGLRPQMKAFHLETEPWVFAINSHGRVAARLEGAFGVKQFTQAVQAALAQS